MFFSLFLAQGAFNILYDQRGLGTNETRKKRHFELKTPRDNVTIKRQICPSLGYVLYWMYWYHYSLFIVSCETVTIQHKLAINFERRNKGNKLSFFCKEKIREKSKCWNYRKTRKGQVSFYTKSQSIMDNG